MYIIITLYSMALIASLQLGDNENRIYPKEYLVNQVKCHVVRPHNLYYADSKPRCERLEVTVIAPGKEDLTLLDWYISQEPMSGRVIVSLSNEAKLGVGDSKEIYFEDGICFRLAEDYNIDAGRRTMTLSIATEALTIDNVEFK